MSSVNSNLFQCFCDSRCLSYSMSKMLDHPDLTAEEKTLIYESLLDIHNAANKIQRYWREKKENTE
ncbi:hypothetical protein AAV35_013850 (plasmid) [Salimicrobium jeotgali]|uniref:Uncharacterized protein n=1 Tax=Salimicrobium jeotgali TaxID=1230341 RepID=A0AAC8T7G1_9BACI|nr:hypothetical protein AAV35_013850 [Salimicrobium jeotgali]MBM7697668.1 hypothetical protein [Salimicrobium jeotgali]